MDEYKPSNPPNTQQQLKNTSNVWQIIIIIIITQKGKNLYTEQNPEEMEISNLKGVILSVTHKHQVC